jgi:hypothetical protein
LGLRDVARAYGDNFMDDITDVAAAINVSRRSGIAKASMADVFGSRRMSYELFWVNRRGRETVCLSRLTFINTEAMLPVEIIPHRRA